MSQLIKELRELKLSAMASGIEEWRKNPLNQNLSFEEQLELLVHSELTGKKNRRINRMLQNSDLKHGIRMEDVEYDEKRGLSKDLYMSLMRLDFLSNHQNIVITGPTGCGKTYLACAIGNKSCIEGYKVKFIKLPLFFDALQVSRLNGGFMKFIQQLMQIDVLILDDFGITTINETQKHDLLTIIDDRYKLKSTIITSQLPIKSWHKYINEPTIADAILDRLLSQSLRVNLQGESMRWKDKIKTDENLIELSYKP